MITCGFYNQDAMLRAGKFVYGPGFTLLCEEKDTYTYPVHGWTWYESAELAAAAFGCAVEDINLDLPVESE